MKFNQYILFVILICINVKIFANPFKYNLKIAPGTLSQNEVTIIWDKQTNVSNPQYELFLNKKSIAIIDKTNFTIKNLLSNTKYTVKIISKKGSQKTSLSFKTANTSTLFNILDYGAKTDTTFINTKAIQAAINACCNGGTVVIPKGTFKSGALFLKSNMTFFIEKDAILKGSIDTSDYLPLIKNRFEGWEMETYASLINVGTLNRNGTYNIKNLRITGGGTIKGGGKKLELACKGARGIRSRGRLILLMNCQNVSIDNLTLTEPPCWSLHYIYSNHISCYNLLINTKGTHNGDGIDPDSSTDSYIFNCTFDTGDDCIAIKSGKNPEGYYVAKPTNYIKITNCNFIGGHGISIGSEMSGGVSNILIQDCKAGSLLYGMQIKGTKERGGYVKNIIVDNCELMKITIFSKLNYNNDGEAAPKLPTFENFTFKNIDLSNANTNEPVININGFKDPKNLLKNVKFENIILPQNAKVIINDAKKITFSNVKSITGEKPEFVIVNGKEIVY